jgi:hypothetical protein
MISEGTSSISLIVSSSSQKDHTAYSSTAFALAGAFHGDFLRCTDEAQRLKGGFQRRLSSVFAGIRCRKTEEGVD